MINSDVMPLAEHPPGARRSGRYSLARTGQDADQAFLPHAPTSNTEFVASLLEPGVAVSTLLACTLAAGLRVDRPTMILAVMVLMISFPGTNRFHHRARRAVFDVWTAWAGKLAFLAICGWLSLSWKFFDSGVLALWAVLTPTLQTAAVLGGMQALAAYHRRPEAQRPALVIGAGEAGAQVGQMLARLQATGHRCVGFLEDRTIERQHPSAHGRVLGGFAQVAEQVCLHGVKDVYITLPLSMQPRIRKLLAEIQDEAVSIFLVPDVFGTRVIQGQVSNLGGVPVVSLLQTPFEGVNGLVKRVSDVVIASILLVLLAPVMAAISLGVKLSSPGPIFFKQRRHGMDGQEILVYKFRSMTTQDNGPVVQQARRGDPRITRFGAFLRRTSLDELPQFINVLQGRMSVVGPRPHAVAHNDEYRQLIPAYMVRHKVKPGITGWAQVNGFRGETDTHDKMAGRVALDLDYLRMWSLGLDLRIIARTVRLVFTDKNAY